MLNSVKAQWAAARQGALARMSPSLQAVVLPLLLTAAIVTALVVMLLWQTSASYRPLFGTRENVVISDVVATLEAEGVPYRLHPESGQVLVAEDSLAKARMLLAAKGVTAKLPEGLELMDRNDPLGVSQFVQDVRFRRGLEGELSRSIATLEAVQAARVHLSIARSSSFVVNTGDKSSASVVLQLKPGQSLQREQIAAVIHMVANSVAGLNPQQVSVTDQEGHFLSARLDLTDGFDPVSHEEHASRLSEELRRNAHELLAATIGPNHFRVTVTADVSQDHTEETYEQYSGDPRVLNEATREENDRNGGIALGIPGSLSNRPVNAPKAESTEQEGNFRAAVSRNYAYDRSVVQVKRGKGRINKLHVAVVLDDAVAPGEAAAWQANDLQRVEQLLRVGLGVDATRGDQLAISSMAFRQPVPAPEWWKDPAAWYDWVVMALWALAGLFALGLLSRLVGVVQRAAREARALPAAVAPAVAAESMPALPANAPPALVGNAVEDDASSTKPRMSMVPLMEDVDLPPPGSQVDVMVEHLRTLAAKEPERVAEVVKQWVQKHGQPAAAEG